MRLTRAEYGGVTLAVLTAAVPLLAWGKLPSSIQVYWGAGLLPDVHVPKSWGVFVLPVISAAICVSGIWTARRGSAQTRSSVASDAGQKAQLAVQSFLLVLVLAPLLVSAGLAESVNRIAAVGFGLLLLILGNLQGKLQRNPLWGTRLPWTVANDEVWL